VLPVTFFLCLTQTAHRVNSYFFLCLTQTAHRVTSYLFLMLNTDSPSCYQLPLLHMTQKLQFLLTSVVATLFLWLLYTISIEKFVITVKTKVLVLGTRTNSWSGVILKVVSYSHCFTLI